MGIGIHNRCPHGRRKNMCAECNPCPHGRVKHDCVVCKSARADPPSSKKRIKREPQSSPEIKQEPFTIQGYFEFDE